MTTNLDGAVVAVVGASGGLGAPIARRLAERGALLVLSGRRQDRLEALAIRAASTVVLDLRDPHAGDALIAAAHDAFGRLDGRRPGAGARVATSAHSGLRRPTTPHRNRTGAPAAGRCEPCASGRIDARARRGAHRGRHRG
jgi:NADP-dependent 3-hydroxy acid dehydrogenase YdfG